MGVFTVETVEDPDIPTAHFFGEATVGVGFEYVLLRSCSLLIFEHLQNKVGGSKKRVRYGDVI